MPILCVAGLMGHGKTYEVTRHMVMSGFLDGRRIVHNIRGINEDRYAEIAVEKQCSSPGSFLFVESQDMRRPDFFPDPENDGARAVVQSGDLIVVDEAAAVFQSNKTVSDRDVRFLTQHRHFDIGGKSIEIILIVQDVKLLPSKVRMLIERLYQVRRHKQFGALGDSRYVVSLFYGNEMKGKPIQQTQRRIMKKEPRLYKSTRTGEGKETDVDNRLAGALRWRMWLIPILLVVLGWSVWFSFRNWQAYHHKASPKPVSSSSGSVSGSAASSAPVGVIPAAHPVSSRWRVVGFVSSPFRHVVILSSPSGDVREVSARLFSWADGYPVEGVLDGVKVTPFSGSEAHSASSVAAPLSAGGEK